MQLGTLYAGAIVMISIMMANLCDPLYGQYSCCGAKVGSDGVRIEYVA